MLIHITSLSSAHMLPILIYISGNLSHGSITKTASGSLKMPGMKPSLNVCMAERVWTKRVLQRELFGFFPLRFLGTIYSLSRVLPDEDGGKYSSSEVTVFYFSALWQPCVGGFFPEYYFLFCIHSSPLKVDSEIQSDFKRTRCTSAGHF